MSGPRVWVDENDLRAAIRLAEGVMKLAELPHHEDDLDFGLLWDALARLRVALDPPPPPPLRPYRACMQGHGA